MNVFLASTAYIVDLVGDSTCAAALPCPGSLGQGVLSQPPKCHGCFLSGFTEKSARAQLGTSNHCQEVLLGGPCFPALGLSLPGYVVCRVSFVAIGSPPFRHWLTTPEMHLQLWSGLAIGLLPPLKANDGREW